MVGWLQPAVACLLSCFVKYRRCVVPGKSPQGKIARGKPVPLSTPLEGAYRGAPQVSPGRSLLATDMVAPARSKPAQNASGPDSTDDKQDDYTLFNSAIDTSLLTTKALRRRSALSAALRCALSRLLHVLCASALTRVTVLLVC